MFSQKAEDTSPLPDFACMMDRMVTCYCAILLLCSKETLKIVDDFAIEESDIFEIQAWSIISLSCSPLNAVLQKMYNHCELGSLSQSRTNDGKLSLLLQRFKQADWGIIMCPHIDFPVDPKKFRVLKGNLISFAIKVATKTTTTQQQQQRKCSR